MMYICIRHLLHFESCESLLCATPPWSKEAAPLFGSKLVLGKRRCMRCSYVSVVICKYSGSFCMLRRDIYMLPGVYSGALFSSVHPLYVVLVVRFELLAFQFECVSDQPGLWRPGLGAQSDLLGDLKSLHFRWLWGRAESHVRVTSTSAITGASLTPSASQVMTESATTLGSSEASLTPLLSVQRHNENEQREHARPLSPYLRRPPP